MPVLHHGSVRAVLRRGDCLHAPRRANQAGLGRAAVGLAAGALGAWVYSFHCTEGGLPFLALWYSLGIAAVTAAGALAGRVLLRW